VAVPAALATPTLQLSVGSPCSGESPPSHENPIEPAAHASVLSAAQLVAVADEN
jgi:hypothetical protein